MPDRGMLKAAAIIVVSFAGFVGTTILLWANKTVSAEMAILMLVALFGLYFGFGILLIVYRFVSKLE